MKPILVIKHFAGVEIHILGPLKWKTNGLCFIVVAIDYSTKWMELQSLILKDYEVIVQIFFYRL